MAEAIAAQNAEGYNYGYNETDSNIGTGNGSQTVFAGSLATPVTPNVLNIYIDDGNTETHMGNDDGAGNLSGDGIASGTIDYATGDLSVTFATPVNNNNDVLVRRRVVVRDEYDGSTNEYNEGFITGLDADNSLTNAGVDFEQFNREQQGQIMMHWFVRSFLNITGTNGNAINYDTSAWDPFQQVVASS
jgi:hypothetical protein